MIITLQLPTHLDPPDAFKPKSIPYLARRNISLIYEIEHRVNITLQEDEHRLISPNHTPTLHPRTTVPPKTHQLRRPLQIRLAQPTPNPHSPGSLGDQKPRVTHMATPARIIRLDIKRPQHPPLPPQLLHPTKMKKMPPHHNRHEIRKPVPRKRLLGKRVQHRIRVPLLDLGVHLRAEEVGEGARYLREAGDGEDRGGRAVAEGDVEGFYGRGEGGVGWGGVRGGAGCAVDCGGGGVAHDGGHGDCVWVVGVL